MMVLTSLERISTPLMAVSKATVAACELFTVIDAPLPAPGLCLKPEEDGDLLSSADLVFEDVSFEYPGRPGVKVLDGDHVGHDGRHGDLVAARGGPVRFEVVEGGEGGRDAVDGRGAGARGRQVAQHHHEGLHRVLGLPQPLGEVWERRAVADPAAEDGAGLRGEVREDVGYGAEERLRVGRHVGYVARRVYVGQEGEQQGQAVVDVVQGGLSVASQCFEEQ